MPSKHLPGTRFTPSSTVQMPKGIPRSPFAIGEAGAANAALFAVALLALSGTGHPQELSDFRAKQTEAVLKAAPLKLSSSEVRRAAQILRAGELVGFPTETVYGLGADAWREGHRTLYAVERHPVDHPVILHSLRRRRFRLGCGRPATRAGAARERILSRVRCNADPEALGACTRIPSPAARTRLGCACRQASSRTATAEGVRRGDCGALGQSLRQGLAHHRRARTRGFGHGRRAGARRRAERGRHSIDDRRPLPARPPCCSGLDQFERSLGSGDRFTREKAATCSTSLRWSSARAAHPARMVLAHALDKEIAKGQECCGVHPSRPGRRVRLAAHAATAAGLCAAALCGATPSWMSAGCERILVEAPPQGVEWEAVRDRLKRACRRAARSRR